MKVFIVAINDCEGLSFECVCSTKEIAERELFKVRDRLVKNWVEADKEAKEYLPKDTMYENMIKALSGNDYENWDNYPHEKPIIFEKEVENG